MAIISSNQGMVPVAAPRTAATPYVVQPTAAIGQELGQIIARIPDLDPQVSAATKPKTDGRVLPQGISTKLTLGTGAALVLGAVLPLLFSFGRNTTKPVKELPDWNNHAAASAPAANSSRADLAPPWPTAKAAVAVPTVVVPQTPRLGDTPTAPQLGDYVPAAMQQVPGPSWSQPQASGSDAVAPQRAVPGPDYAQRNPLEGRGNAGGYRGDAGPRAWQADSRNDPAQRYSNNLREDTLGPPPSTPGTSQRAPYTPPDDRYNTDRYNTDRYAPAPAAGGSAQPNGGYGGTSYTTQPQPGSDSGVARFDGSISNPPPPATTNYDRSGPIHY